MQTRTEIARSTQFFSGPLERNEQLLSSFDLIFIDRHHLGWALELYFTKIVSLCREVAVFLVDDIDWSEGMKICELLGTK
jgi:hypothetical protein